MYLIDSEALIEDTLRTLANIDFEHELEIDKLETSNTSDDLKYAIAKKLKARHQERREPYVRLLEQLQRHASQRVQLGL